MVTEAADVIAAVGPMLDRLPEPPAGIAEPAHQEAAPATADESDRARLEAALGKAPVTYDEIVRFTGLKPAVVHFILLELDLAGRIERHPGQRVSLA